MSAYGIDSANPVAHRAQAFRAPAPCTRMDREVCADEEKLKDHRYV